MENPGTNVDFALFYIKKNRMVNPYGKFSEPDFPPTFAKKKRSPGPKHGLYGCVSTPATICAQN
jgi:hypothetical protein